MNSIVAFILLFCSFIVLWLSSEKAIHNASEIAHQMGISNLFIGFVILSFATGFPELLVAAQSLVAGYPLLSVGAIVGSNFIDISLALGITAACIGPIYIELAEYKKQLVMLGISSFAMALIFINGHITRGMGIALVATYAMGTFWLYKMRRVRFETNGNSSHFRHLKTITKNGMLLRMIGHLLLLLIASKVAVSSAIAIATNFNLSLSIMGATILAVGTSLPEISLNIQAVRQKNYSMALGNSLGSVFGQAALILGMLATFSPSPLPVNHLYSIIPFMFASYGIILMHLITRKKINRISGLAMIGLYGAYIVYELWLSYY